MSIISIIVARRIREHQKQPKENDDSISAEELVICAFIIYFAILILVGLFKLFLQDAQFVENFKKAIGLL